MESRPLLPRALDAEAMTLRLSCTAAETRVEEAICDHGRLAPLRD